MKSYISIFYLLKQKFFTGQMPFLSYNQKHHIIGGINIRFHTQKVNDNKGMVTVRTLGFSDQSRITLGPGQVSTSLFRVSDNLKQSSLDGSTDLRSIISWTRFNVAYKSSYPSSL